MAKGGKRPGAGRPPGSKDKVTLEKEKVLAEYRKKIMENAGFLFRQQAHLAKGVSYLYKFKKGKARPDLVTDPEEIEEYILSEEGNPQDHSYLKLDKKSAYYFISTERPDNKAIDSMLDRAFGKPAQPLSGDKDNPIVIEFNEIKVKRYGKERNNSRS